MSAPALVLPEPPFLPVTAPVWDISLYVSASLAMVLWDYILTLPNEIALYSRRGFMRVTVPFVIVRYLSIAGLVMLLAAIRKTWANDGSCDPFARAIPYVANVVTLGASSIFVFRTWAIYNRSRLILAVLAFLWVGQAVCTLTFNTFVLPITGPGGLSCIPLAKPQPNVYFAYYIVNVVFDACIVGMSSWRLLTGIKHSPSTTNAAVWRQRLLADGLLYFIAVLIVNILNAVFFAANPSWQYSNINAAFNVAVTAISANRLVMFGGSESKRPLGNIGAFVMTGKRGADGSGSGSGSGAVGVTSGGAGGGARLGGIGSFHGGAGNGNGLGMGIAMGMSPPAGHTTYNALTTSRPAPAGYVGGRSPILGAGAGAGADAGEASPVPSAHGMLEKSDTPFSDSGATFHPYSTPVQQPRAHFTHAHGNNGGSLPSSDAIHIVQRIQIGRE